MAIPERIPVARLAVGYSTCMGFYDLDTNDNQFWGRVVASGSTVPKPPPLDPAPFLRWHAVLHKFDGRGNHIGTDHWYAGTTAIGEQEASKRASEKLDEMVAALGEVEFSGIEIKLFQVEIDGGIFGLDDVSEPEEGPEFADRVEMWPGSLLFQAPWNGNYDT